MPQSSFTIVKRITRSRFWEEVMTGSESNAITPEAMKYEFDYVDSLRPPSPLDLLEKEFKKKHKLPSCGHIVVEMQVQMECEAIWGKMSDSEKAPYVAMAEVEKEQYDRLKFKKILLEIAMERVVKTKEEYQIALDKVLKLRE